MKAVIFAATVFASVFAQAASSYDCNFQTQEGTMAIAMTPTEDGNMKVVVGGEESVCLIDETPETATAINGEFQANGITIDTEVVVGCEAPTADGSLYAIISKTDIVAQDVPAATNTVILNPVVGPVAVGTCTKK